MVIQGSCHCGNISFALTWEPEPTSIAARVCGCTFCTKHGGVWTSNPSGALSVAVRDLALDSRYSFGTSTAVFHVCARCGNVPVVTSEIEDRLYAVVNVNAFDNVPVSWLRRTAADFEGEDVESRLARRRRGWLPDVRFTAGAPG